jgi:hypothetical protein
MCKRRKRERERKEKKKKKKGGNPEVISSHLIYPSIHPSIHSSHGQLTTQVCILYYPIYMFCGIGQISSNHQVDNNNNNHLHARAYPMLKE